MKINNNHVKKVCPRNMILKCELFEFEIDCRKNIQNKHIEATFIAF